jgi:RNA polymerase sigma-70 factor (ECF subfamily)
MSRCRRQRVERNGLCALSADPCSWTAPQPYPVMERLSPPVQRALDELPTEFRKVVMLVDLGDMSYKAAAKQLRTPVGTVMSRLYRGRRALAESLREAA